AALLACLVQTFFGTGGFAGGPRMVDHLVADCVRCRCGVSHLRAPILSNRLLDHFGPHCASVAVISAVQREPLLYWMYATTAMNRPLPGGVVAVVDERTHRHERDIE